MEEKKERIRAEPYIKIPVDLMGLGLSPGAVLAFGLLWDRAKYSADLSCVYPDKELCEKLRQSRSSVARLIHELMDNGLIKRERTATRTGKSKNTITAFIQDKNDLINDFTCTEYDTSKPVLVPNMTQLNDFTCTEYDTLLVSNMTQPILIYRTLNQNRDSVSLDGENLECSQDAEPQKQPKKARASRSGTTITEAQALNGLADLYNSPDVVEAWAAFLAMRKQQKKPVGTMRALNGLIKKLDELAKTDADRIAVIDQATMKGWTSFFPLKDADKKPSGGSLGGWGDIDI